MSPPATPSRLRAALRRQLGAGQAPPPPPGALERRLTARFDELHPEGTVTVHSWLRTATVAVGLLAAAAAASQVPADVKAEIGKRIELRTPEPLGPERIQEALRALGVERPGPGASPAPGGGAGAAPAGSPRRLEVQVRVRRGEAGPVETRIDLWGDTARLEDVEGTLRRAVPALAGAEIAVAPVEGTVRTDVGGAVARWLGRKDLTDAQVAEALRKELAAEQGGDVEVKVERGGGPGQEKVEVRVRRQEVVEQPPGK